MQMLVNKTTSYYYRTTKKKNFTNIQDAKNTKPIFLHFLWQGKRGGKPQRQRTQIRQNTPDASGNVFACADKNQQGFTTFYHAQKHCSGQRGDYFIGNDTRRPKINYEI